MTVVVERIPKKNRLQPLELAGLTEIEKQNAAVAVADVALPSVGRIVHFKGAPTQRYGGLDWHAAIVTSATGLRVNLRVFFDNGPIEYVADIAHESKNERRVWRWPPRT